MSEDTASTERRGSSWLKGQLNLPNIVAMVGIVVGLTAAKAAVDTKNEIQDLKLSALEKRLDVAESTAVRRDLYDQRLANIEDKLNTTIQKLDSISKAVR